MGRFSIDLSKAVPGGFSVWPKGDYQVDLKEPKPFIRPKKDENGNDTDELSYGVGVVIVGKDGEGKEHSGYYNMWLHSEKAMGMVIEFLCAAYGFDPRDDKALKEFKAQYNITEENPVGITQSDEDESIEMDEIFKNLAGRKLNVAVTIGKNKGSGDDQNNYRWMPFEPEAALTE